MTTERPLEEITWQTYRDEFCPQERHASAS